MHARAFAAFLLLPVVVALERFAGYASRSTLVDLFRDRLPKEALAELYARPDVAILLAPLVAGLLAAVLLPRVTLVIGGVLSAWGYALLGGAGTLEEARLALDVLAVGSGALRVSAFALAALLPGSLRLRAAAIVVVSAGIHLVAFLSPLLVEGLESLGALWVLPRACAVALLLATFAAAGAVVVDRLSPEEAAPPAVWRRRALVGALAMWLLSVPGALLLFPTVNDPGLLEWSGAGGERTALSYLIHPLAALLASSAVCAVLFRWEEAHPSPLRRLVVVGFGLAVSSSVVLQLGHHVLGSASSESGAPTRVLVAFLLGASATSGPLLLARALTGHRPRVVPLLVGAWLAFPHLSWLVVDHPYKVWGLGTLLAVGGAALVHRKGHGFEAWLDERAPPPPPVARESWLSGR